MSKRRQKHQSLLRFFSQREAVDVPQILKAGIGAFVAIALLGLLLEPTGLPLLIAPFGASAILVYGYPGTAFAQPLNVLGSYLIAAAIAFVAASQCPGAVWATALAVALSLIVMMSLRVTHPPAGAIPLIAFADPSHVIQLTQVAIVGAVILIVLAFVLHRLPPRSRYTVRPSPESPNMPPSAICDDDVSSND